MQGRKADALAQVLPPYLWPLGALRLAAPVLPSF